MNHIDALLKDIGIPMNIKGYKALKSAITMASANPDILESITKELYPAVADEVGTTASKAERTMRHAIEVAFDRCHPEITAHYFGNTIDPNKGKPTNSEFIAIMAAYASEKQEKTEARTV